MSAVFGDGGGASYTTAAGADKPQPLKRLAAAGIPPARVAELVCPIGVPGVESKLPAAIAAATVTQLIIRDEALRLAAADASAAGPRLRGGSTG